MEDKRITSSKARIKTGLLECLKESGLEGVSIKAVCDKIGINRCTFYAHYDNLQQVYSQLEEEFLLGLDPFYERYVRKEIDFATFLHETLTYLLERKETLHTLLKTNFASLVSSSIESSKKHLDIQGDKVYVAPFSYAGGLMLLYQWLEQGEKESPQDIETILLGLLLRNNLGIQD